MNIGFTMTFNQFTEPALISDSAILIEEMGAYSVWAPEHVMFFPEYAYTAKMVADLDYLSGGRVDFGVGIGWLKEEFVNLGMDFKNRAARCAEY